MLLLELARFYNKYSTKIQSYQLNLYNLFWVVGSHLPLFVARYLEIEKRGRRSID